MPVNTQSVHTDKIITNMAMVYKPQGLIWQSVFPIVNTDNMTDIYYVQHREDMLAIRDDFKASGVPANLIDLSESTETFECKPHYLAHPLADRVKSNADPGMLIAQRKHRMMVVKNGVELNTEKRVAALVTDPTVITYNAGVSVAWTDHANATPVTDLMTAINADNFGEVKPNKVVFGRSAWENAVECAQTITRVYGDGSGNDGRTVTEKQMASVLRVETVLVGEARSNTAAKGQALVLADVWGDHVLVCFTPKQPSIYEPSLAYPFRWKKDGLSERVRVIRDMDAETEKIEFGYEQTEKVTAVHLGFLIKNVETAV